MEVELFLDEDYLKMGIKKFITWNMEHAAHVLIVGSSGSGKTYCTKLLLGRLILSDKYTQAFVADFKNDKDFEFLSSSPRFYRYTECLNGLNDFYQRFQDRQSGKEKDRNKLVILFDEYAAFVNSWDKKEADEVKRKMANLLMMARSFNMHILISLQRADATYFNTARDNLGLVIGMGNLGDEAKNMVFSGYKLKADRKRGTGYILVNGADLKPIVVPTIKDMSKLHSVIWEGVNR